jgi:hypothetical protein
MRPADIAISNNLRALQIRFGLASSTHALFITKCGWKELLFEVQILDLVIETLFQHQIQGSFIQKRGNSFSSPV